MSGDGSVTFAWGDGEHRFRLGIGELRELQDFCGVGPYVILNRLRDGTWRVDDVREPLRLGLIGGGMNSTQALAKIGRYFVPGGYERNVIAATVVMAAALLGVSDDMVGKVLAAVDAANSMNESGLAPSSESLPLSDGQSTNSTGQAYGSSPPLSTGGTVATEVLKPNGPTR